ncbi:hypothetical protein PAPYR_4313 [Paratrimastix pyriformis]|uniref:Uncharacterized protein n=1 Tax=Paratrimastix pyriformis TaxID=342808 RepID=A0ABQ8UPE4_9EUKA|nr:hypothetical protein PAPYR_4313 [Paratrimastix pyriformis]
MSPHLETVSLEQRAILTNYVTCYQNRIILLEKELEPSDVVHASVLAKSKESPMAPAAFGFAPDTFEIQFEEIPFPSTEPAPPPASSRRSFWLLGIMMRSMQGGAWLTPRLYLPASIWVQQGAPIAAFPEKMTACGTMRNHVLVLRQINHLAVGPGAYYKALETFYRGLVAVQNGLSSCLSFVPELEIPEAKKKTGVFAVLEAVGHNIAKGAKRLGTGVSRVENPRSYVDGVVAFIEPTLYLADVIEHFESQKQPPLDILDLLSRINEIFLQAACSWLCRDASALLERHLRKARESFSRIFAEK